MPVTSLPKIIAVLACDDHGPCYDGVATANCPHCGAEGRYVYTFICEDGTTRGAMAGCIKLYPRSIAADECEKALAKKIASDSKKGGYVSRWDQRMLDAIKNLQHGTITAQQIEAIAMQNRREKADWMRAKGYRR